jgi:GT2 family glycosyltransferase
MSDERQATADEQRTSDSVVCSVIIPSYRSAATIAACLVALTRQRDAPPYEIIVVDSSPDATPEIIRQQFPQAQLIHLGQQTDPAAARNLGAQQARGALLAFIDSDCIAPPNWLAQLCARLQAGYDAVGGAIANANDDALASWASYLCEFREFLPGGSAHDTLNLTLGNAAYRRSAFEATGGFPTGCFPQEDQVFHLAFRTHGFRIRLDPGIVVAHTHRAEWRAFLAHQRRIGQANARVLRWIDLPGSWLARRPWLAAALLPALVPFRFARTLFACRRVQEQVVLRRPLLAWLCWLGMCWWGWGFLEGARDGPRAQLALHYQGT